MEDYVDKMEDSMWRVKESSKVLDSSASLMKYMIQDLLDFAQIKAGKFRKNI